MAFEDKTIQHEKEAEDIVELAFQAYLKHLSVPPHNHVYYRQPAPQ